METTMEFTKLEKVEISGRKGKILSQFVITIYEEFQELFKVFTERTYDPLDPSDTVSRTLNYRQTEEGTDEMCWSCQ